MKMLYSDEYLPGKGELAYNMRNFDRDRMVLFDEKSAFDGLMQEGLFPSFSKFVSGSDRQGLISSM